MKRGDSHKLCEAVSQHLDHSCGSPLTFCNLSPCFQKHEPQKQAQYPAAMCTSAKPGGNTTPYSYGLLYLAIRPGNLLVFQLQTQVGSHMHLVFHHSLTELLLPETASSSSARPTFFLSKCLTLHLHVLKCIFVCLHLA